MEFQSNASLRVAYLGWSYYQLLAGLISSLLCACPFRDHDSQKKCMVKIASFDGQRMLKGKMQRCAIMIGCWWSSPHHSQLRKGMDGLLPSRAPKTFIPKPAAPAMIWCIQILENRLTGLYSHQWYEVLSISPSMSIWIHNCGLQRFAIETNIFPSYAELGNKQIRHF